MTRSYTIGQVARLSGLTARKVRFYADQGLLPPAGRTGSGYRVFGDADIARLDLIRSLREAGAGLDMIRGVLGQRLSLKDVLAMRLAEVEANVASQRRLAGTLRAALKSDEPSQDDLRRIKAMTDMSHAERRDAVRGFYDEVTRGQPVDPSWKLRMVEVSTPELPDEPTPQQVEAWIELAVLLRDPDFMDKMRAQARDIQPPGDKGKSSPDQIEAFYEARAAMAKAAREAMRNGIAPDSEAGRALAQDNIAMMARMRGTEPDAAFHARLQRQFWEHDPNLKRYWDLMGMLRGADFDVPSPEGRWIKEATKVALKPEGR